MTYDFLKKAALESGRSVVRAINCLLKIYTCLKSKFTSNMA